jgi:phage-related tail protein
VKRAFASLAGLIGIAALGRWLAKRTHPVASPVEPVEATAADPAEELRRKLADARVAEPDVAPVPEPPDETLDERRARVHAKAREAIDSMASDSPGDDGTAS